MTQPFGVVTDQGHFVRSDVLEGYAVKESRQLPPQPKFEGFKGLLAPKYDPVQLAGLLEVNTAHLVACRQKAEDVLGRGWQMVRTSDDADPAVRDEVLAWLGAVPPPEAALDSSSNRSVLTAAQFDFEAVGRGALELVRQGDLGPEPNAPIATLVHVPAHTLRVHRDGVRFVQSKGGRRRWFKWAGASIDVDFETGQTRDLGELPARRRATEIAWWTNYHPSDPVYGLPDVIPAIGAVHGDLGRRDYNLEFFSNFGVPSYAVFVTGDFDPGDFVDKDGEPASPTDAGAKTEMEWHIEGLLADVRKNPHSSLVFSIPTRPGMEDGEVKVEFQPLATEVKEASFRAYRRDNREEILSSHRMSAAIAGVYDAGSANREARGQYKQSVVWPRRAQLETIVNHFILPAFGADGWRWQIQAIDSREEDHDLDLLTALHEKRAVSSREMRERFADRLGLDPDKMPDDQDAGVAQVGIPALLTQQVITRNEARTMLGLDEVTGGDEFVSPEDEDAMSEVAAALRSMRNDLVDIATKDLGASS